MKKVLFTLSLCLAAFICFSFANNDAENKSTSSDDKDRLIVDRLFDVQNLQFRRDSKPTVFQFRILPEDSLRLTCGDCYSLLKGEKPSLKISIVSEDGTQQLTTSEFDFEQGWIKPKCSNGVFNLTMEHTGTGDKNLEVRNLRMWKKTNPNTARK